MTALEATRKSDNKILYFRDQESYDDYLLTYGEELTKPKFCFEVPFGNKVIDWNQRRSDMSILFNAAGLSMKEVSEADLFGRDTEDHSFEDTDKRMKEAHKVARKTFDIKDGQMIETDDDYREVKIRQEKAQRHTLFRAFVEALDDTRRNAVANVFIEHNLNLDDLEALFDEELNMDISFWLQEYDTTKAYLIAGKEFKKTDTYKIHHNFISAIEDSYEAVRQMDIDNDYQIMKPNLNDPEIIPVDQQADNKVMVNGKYVDDIYHTNS